VGDETASIRHIGTDKCKWYHQGTRAVPAGHTKHACQQMPDKVARVAAAAAVERGTDRMAASVPERWPNRQHELHLQRREYQPGGKVNCGRAKQVRCCAVVVRLLCSRLSTKCSMHVPLWRSDLCHMPIHVDSRIHSGIVYTSILLACIDPSIHY